jgi:polysaccharide biosynthesis protein VpsM
MTTKFTMRALVTGVGIALAGPALALEPASLGQGSLKFTPTLDVSTGYDDNFRTDTSGDSSWITTVQPNLELSTVQGANRYAATYSIAQEWVHDFSEEDNTNQALDLSADLVFNARNRLELGAFWQQTEEITAAGLLNDEFTNTGVNALYGFGVAGAPINADFGYRFDQRRSDNAANADDERDQDNYTATLYYRLSPRTQALAEVRYRTSDFRSASERDNDSLAYLVGARWAATAMTTGSVRVGYQEQSFDEPGRPDETSTVWGADVTWAPLTYSRVSLFATRSLEDAEAGASGDAAASSMRTTVLGVDWNHDWSGRLTSTIGLSDTRDKYDTGRDDTTQNFNAGVSYELRRWLDVGFRYDYEDRDSTLDTETWDRNRYMLLLNMSL